MKEVLDRLIDDFHERDLPELLPRDVAAKVLPRKADVVIGMRRAGKTWFWLGRTRYLGLLAEAYESEGQLDAALGALTEALQAVETREERPYESELYRLKGGLTLQSEVSSPEVRTTAAETCLQTALDVARDQHAKSFELRAATSLARLWQQQGKRAEARDLLAPVYNWFTEGFDTKDLQEARVFLEELI